MQVVHVWQRSPAPLPAKAFAQIPCRPPSAVRLPSSAASRSTRTRRQLARLVVTTRAAAEPVFPAAVDVDARRVEQLRAERDAAKAAFIKAEAVLRKELEARSALARREAGAPQEMDNFGYIRLWSGEPYDNQVMGVPGSLQEMGFENFLREGRELLAAIGFKVPLVLRGEVGARPPERTPEMLARQEQLAKLTLSNKAIWDRENARPPVRAPWVIKGPYYLLCWVLDVLFDGRPIARFWLLETVARMPYLSYITMLHLYETLGWWRRSYDARKVHFAEEWNEAHHLLIMESLGGDQKWVDRFCAQHAAIIYYCVLAVLWFLSPTLAYNFSELIEAHAVDTYEQFVEENEEALRELPPPRVAKQYYESADLYLFDEFQTSRPPGSRRVTVDNLYDVFRNIADDEGEHVATMRQMQDEDVLSRAPNTEALAFTLLAALLGANFWLRSEAGADLLGEGAIEGAAEGLDAAAPAIMQQLAAVLEAVLETLLALF